MGVISTVDIVVVILSLCAVFGVSLWATLKRKRTDDAAAEYFLAGRNTPWWLIAASLVASNIGTEHFVGQAGAGAHSGVVLGLYDWLSVYTVSSLGWFFAPVYLRVKLTTIPQLLEERFNKYCRGLFVSLLLMLYVLSKIGTSVYAGVVLLDVILGWSMWRSVPIIIISTAIYTMCGGLKAVMYTDALQLCIFVVGGLAGSITAFHLVGGMNGLNEKYKAVGLNTSMHLFRSLDDRDYPWLAMVFNIPISGIAYWCIDQEMVQRVLAGKNLTEVRLGTSTAGLMKLLPSFITVFPGMVARVLFELCRHGEDNRFPEWCSANLDDGKNADKAYPLLIVNNFPTGIKGLMIASFLAAMMSSISSVFNSASTVFTYDIYERLFGPSGGSSPQRLTAVGRVLICVLTGLTLCYLPVIDRANRGLFCLGNIALSHFAPPLSAMFVAGLFIARTNGHGALIGVVTGSLLGITRFVLYELYQGECDSDCNEHHQVLTVKNWFVCLNFNYFAIILFFWTLMSTVIASLAFPSPSKELIEGSHESIDGLTNSCAFTEYTFHFRDLKGPTSSDADHQLLLSEVIEEEKSTDSPSKEWIIKYRLAVGITILAIISASTVLIHFH